MNKTLTVIRLLFFFLCIAGAYLLWYADGEEKGESLTPYIVVGVLLGALTVLVDVLLKGFSLRGLTAITFGLGMGVLISFLISTSPLLENGDAEVLYLVRLSLFVVCMYLGSVIALRGRDDFNLVIPYMRFVPQKVDSAIVVVDTSALIDGRIIGICQSRFLIAELVVPRFVLDELQNIADSSDPSRQARGRKGLDVLNELRGIPHIHFTIHESEVGRGQQVDAKLIFVAETLKAKLLTTDYNLARLAEFQGVDWLNITALAKALNPEVDIGEALRVTLVKVGRESGQAVGYLGDGSMVVVNDAAHIIGQEAKVEVTSVLPSAGGKMVFARLLL
ncbi:PIN/TRAM domain-containing protein [Cerasicoccus arenae]|uniref:PIN/TRAM domain-containing protein n=1 Tax=Cerasicoccus arenae TaxID=424488 RepID=A0A8J3GD96_9BACT|nr:PIN domain-containing protein [Cerasicoccus arenae]MBK1856810.1 TRAM domain-containing protein [Cerasicoccus arenae]GHB99653.1 PIN/TRAM domain-containing protein [Cerasicoccus arenae]